MRRPTSTSTARVAMLTYSVKPRGGVVHAIELARALERRGHRVELAALARAGESFFRDPGVRAHLVRHAPDPRSSFDERVAKLFSEAKTPEQLDALRKHMAGIRVPRQGDGLPVEIEPIEGDAYYCSPCEVELPDLPGATRHANSAEHASALAAAQATA